MDFEEFQQILSPIFSQNQVKRALLFGSSARGTRSRKSDLDILIIMDSEKRFFHRFDPFNEIYDRLPGWAIDLLIYTPEELEQISHRPFIQRLLREGKTIYEQGKEPARSTPLV